MTKKTETPVPFLSQGIRYGIIGTLSASMDFATLNALIRGLDANYYVAAGLSFFVSATFGFFSHRRWTFRGHVTGKSTQKEYAQFMVMGITGLVVNTVALALVLRYFGPWYNVAKAISIIIIAVTNFLLSRYWVFRHRSE